MCLTVDFLRNVFENLATALVNSLSRKVIRNEIEKIRSFFNLSKIMNSEIRVIRRICKIVLGFIVLGHYFGNNNRCTV